MKNIFFIIILLSALNIIIAEADNYEGFIFDKTTGVPLAFAHICDNKGKLLCQSNEDGKFNFSFTQTDSLRLTASYVGYSLYKMSFESKASNLLIAMSPHTNDIESVEVFAVRTPININKQYSQTSVYSAKIQENVSTSLIDVMENVLGLVKKAE